MNREQTPVNTSCYVRRATPRDLDRIDEIERASFGLDAYDRNLFATYLRRAPGLFLVAGRGGVLGYMLTCTQGERAELVSVAVDPAARRSGVATALLRRTLRALETAGVARFALAVREDNSGARLLYESFGFVAGCKLPGYYEDGTDGLRMVKRLQRPAAGR
jgi:[ribosomal protein S18]-alanine N-acetyltransferase